MSEARCQRPEVRERRDERPTSNIEHPTLNEKEKKQKTEDGAGLWKAVFFAAGAGWLDDLCGEYAGQEGCGGSSVWFFVGGQLQGSGFAGVEAGCFYG
ncbi:MAG: hypothetical protein JRE47_06700 [Deltaproteobacteria bacterium]|nr:hypothetical protein [Deltaproteobacteria bacterium]